MPNFIDYSALSAIVYNDTRHPDNRITSSPAGWSLVGTDSSGITGFTAQAYQNGNDVVIAYKGTDFDSLLPAAADFAFGNISALGVPSPQLFQAALFYQQTKAAHPGANITFTGHSLGGGIASVMSAWFDRPATTFAEAPFEAAALNPIAMAAVAAYLGMKGYMDTSLLSLIPTYPITYAGREAQVSNYFIQGEALQNFRTLWPTVLGSDNPIAIGGGDSLSGNTLHSINLHAALVMQDRFRANTVSLPNLLLAIFDESLYARPLASSRPDFLTHLLNDQIKVGYSNPDGLLARFAGDIEKLTQLGDNLTTGALSKALVGNAANDETSYAGRAAA